MSAHHIDSFQIDDAADEPREGTVKGETNYKQQSSNLLHCGVVLRVQNWDS